MYRYFISFIPQFHHNCNVFTVNDFNILYILTVLISLIIICRYQTGSKNIPVNSFLAILYIFHDKTDVFQHSAEADILFHTFSSHKATLFKTIDIWNNKLNQKKFKWTPFNIKQWNINNIIIEMKHFVFDMTLIFILNAEF